MIGVLSPDAALFVCVVSIVLMWIVLWIDGDEA